MIVAESIVCCFVCIVVYSIFDDTVANIKCNVRSRREPKFLGLPSSVPLSGPFFAPFSPFFLLPLPRPPHHVIVFGFWNEEHRRQPLLSNASIDTDPTITMTEAATKMDTDSNDDKPFIKVNKRPSIPDESIQMPWVEKYRPAKLEDLVAHEDIVSILTKLIDNDNLPHLLLYGPPGTGKVSAEYCRWFV